MVKPWSKHVTECLISVPASGRAHDPETMELRLIQSKKDIETPPTLLVSTKTA